MVQRTPLLLPLEQTHSPSEASNTVVAGESGRQYLKKRMPGSVNWSPGSDGTLRQEYLLWMRKVNVSNPVPMQACFIGNGSNHKCKKVKEGESRHVFGKSHPHDISICSSSPPNPFIRLNGVLSIFLSGLIFDNLTNNISMVNH